MLNNTHESLDYNKWNRRLMNLYWICNIIIAVVEISICISYFTFYKDILTTPTELTNISVTEYIFRYILKPSVIVLFITIICEILIHLTQKNYRKLQPYIVTFTCVVLCTVLVVIHNGVHVIYVLCIMPVFFSLVYNNKRVLRITFIFSLLSFFCVFIYISIKQFAYVSFKFPELSTNIALILLSYLICDIILDRFNEIIAILVEKQRTEYELELAKSLAEAKVEARTRFLANISHDIRTPMNGIIGLAELGLDDTTTLDIQKNYLAKIKSSAEWLLAIINDILDFSKIDAGELTLEKISFCLGDLLNECDTIMIHEAKEKGISLYVYDNTELMDTIVGDPTRLRQVLLNLLSNAVKFTKEGFVILTANCDNHTENSDTATVNFQIKDTGIGMTEEQRITIFEPFQQADISISRYYGGTGLGLSIAKNIIEIMGGNIEVESVPGIGSIFSFSITFPLFDEKNNLPVPMTSPITTITQPLFDGEALVCEDNEMNQQVIVENLEKIGFCVTVAENGKIGIEIVQSRQQAQKPFDVIFMDINMPVMDGLETSQRLMEMGIQTPIIAVTANIMAGDMEKYLSIGMSDCISKPFMREDLWACLLTHLEPVGQKPVGVFARSTEQHDTSKIAIDRTIGIENSAGNEALFIKMLILFAEKQRNTYDQLETATAESNYSLAREIAHKEGGFAAIIGAVQLSELLFGLEELLKSATPSDPRSMLEEYSQELDHVLDCIADMNLLPIHNEGGFL